MKPELIKLTALSGNHERYWAHLVAGMLKRGATKAACVIIEHFDRGRMEFLTLLADAIKDGAKWEPSTCRRRQIEAWDAAVVLDEQATGNPWIKPTLGQWKKQFQKLFPKAKLPADMTFRRTFKELKLPLAKERTGRPKGSRDKPNVERKLRSDKGKLRKNWLKKRRP
jgi:hypothetical protein